VVSGRRLVSGVSGVPAVAAGVCVSGVRGARRVADGEGQVDVRGVWPADVGDGRQSAGKQFWPGRPDLCQAGELGHGVRKTRALHGSQTLPSKAGCGVAV